MQVFWIMKIAGMMINVNANVKNWLIMVYAIKDILGIQVIESANVVIMKSCDVGEFLDCENCKLKKTLVDRLVKECSEIVDEAKLAEIALFEH